MQIGSNEGERPADNRTTGQLAKCKECHQPAVEILGFCKEGTRGVAERPLTGECRGHEFAFKFVELMLAKDRIAVAACTDPAACSQSSQITMPALTMRCGCCSWAALLPAAAGKRLPWGREETFKIVERNSARTPLPAAHFSPGAPPDYPATLPRQRTAPPNLRSRNCGPRADTPPTG